MSGEKFSFMVVDDSAFARSHLERMLVALGGRSTGSAENGVQAVDRYLENKPDVVFMDITMPEMEGVEAVEHITKSDSSARIVMVSSLGYEEMIKKALSRGARHFLTKPVNSTQVGAVVAFVLGEA